MAVGENFYELVPIVLSSGIVAAIVSWITSRRQIAVEAITKERITWLDELRDIIAKLCAALAVVYRDGECGKVFKGSPAPNGVPAIEAADDQLARLQLHLKPGGKEEEILIKAADSLKELADGSSQACCGKAGSETLSYRMAEKDFIFLARSLLKREWEKAKREAGVGKSKSNAWVAFVVFFISVATAANVLYTTNRNGVW